MLQRRARFVFIILAAIALVLQATSTSWAASIRVKGKRTITGDILSLDDHDVIIRMPRQEIVTVDGKVLPPPLIQGVAAPTFTVRDLSGTLQQVAAGAGHMTVLHFWVSWCPHCRSDAPKIQALYDRFHESDQVRVITVNLDRDRQQLEAFLNNQHVTYPVIVAQEQASAPGGVDVPTLYQITGFPVTLLIDEEGIIRHKTVGSFVESHLDLEALIATQQPGTAHAHTPPTTR